MLLAVLVLDGHTAENEEKLESQGETVTESRKSIITSVKSLEELNNLNLYSQAYEMAGHLVENHEGEEQFDFNFGLAAVETQHFDQALFAFERLVLNDGEQPRYRLELARTHFYLRNLERSEIEFNRVLKQNPPKPVQDNVYDFLLRISDLKNSVEPQLYVSIDLVSGFDSNINSATDENVLPKEELVFINDVRLNDDARETESGYWGTLFNVYYLRPFTKRSALDMKLVASNKANFELRDYDLTTAITEAGYNYYFDSFHVRGGGKYQIVGVDDEHFLDSATGMLQLNYTMRNEMKLGASASAGLLVYEDNSDGDLNQTKVSFSVSSPVQKHSWALLVFAGKDEAEESVNDFNGKEYAGATLQSTNLWGNRISYYGVLSIADSEYDEINRALYTQLREDTLVTGVLGLRYSFNSNLGFRTDVSLTDSDSTLEANTYQRSKIEFGMSFRF
jgi:tetratricopeptide (TPR) repeat protein